MSMTTATFINRPLAADRARRLSALQGEENRVAARRHLLAMRADPDQADELAGLEEQLQGIRRRVDRLTAADGVRAAMVAEIIGRHGGRDAVVGALAKDLRSPAISGIVAKADSLRAQIRGHENWLQSAGRLGYHPGEIADRAARLESAREALAEAEAKAAEARRREAARLVDRAAGGSRNDTIELERAARGFGLHVLARDLSPIGDGAQGRSDAAQAAGVAAEFDEYPAE